MKLCKFASSAMQYEDSKTAIENLTKALNLLTTGKENWIPILVIIIPDLSMLRTAVICFKKRQSVLNKRCPQSSFYCQHSKVLKAKEIYHWSFYHFLLVVDSCYLIIISVIRWLSFYFYSRLGTDLIICGNAIMLFFTLFHVD